MQVHATIGKTSMVETEEPGNMTIPPTAEDLLCGSRDPAMDLTEEARTKIKEGTAKEGSTKRDKSKVATVRVPHSAAVQISDCKDKKPRTTAVPDLAIEPLESRDEFGKENTGCVEQLQAAGLKLKTQVYTRAIVGGPARRTSTSTPKARKWFCMHVPLLALSFLLAGTVQMSTGTTVEEASEFKKCISDPKQCTSLDLAGRGLTGAIPTKLGMLVNLQIL